MRPKTRSSSRMAPSRGCRGQPSATRRTRSRISRSTAVPAARRGTSRIPRPAFTWGWLVALCRPPRPSTVMASTLFTWAIRQTASRPKQSELRPETRAGRRSAAPETRWRRQPSPPAPRPAPRGPNVFANSQQWRILTHCFEKKPGFQREPVSIYSRKKKGSEREFGACFGRLKDRILGGSTEPPIYTR